MEIIEINGRKWQKSIGDEGQDVYVAQFVIDEDSSLGKYMDDNSYDILIDKDTDFYLPNTSVTSDSNFNEDDVAFKFRKNVFTKEEQAGCFEGLYDAAGESNNRGHAAGPRGGTSGKRDWVSPYQSDVLDYYIKGQPAAVDGSNPLESIKEKHASGSQDNRGSVWLRKQVEDQYGEYSTFFGTLMDELEAMSIKEARNIAKTVKEKYISDTSYATAIWSGIAGFFGRYPRIPYGRATAYVDHNREKFEKSYPFARKLETEFKRMLPIRWERQYAYAKKMDKKFLIGEDTTFTTITVNTTSGDRNARMACHRDAGSLNAGYSNLTVVTKDGKDWKGGYLVTPEVRAAINCRPGDLLLIDNMRIIHANTPIAPPDSGIENFLRMSLIFYFREDMANLGSWEYEQCRKNYVDHRRLNKEHKLWKEYWNGVSPSMWGDKEWYDYLTSTMGNEALTKYHPEANVEKSSLDSFF
jgi:hypothetical protein